MKAKRGPDFSLVDALEAAAAERFVLSNGLTLLVRDDASFPVASVQVWVGTGSIHEDRLLGSGVSHFVEHMLFKGTEKRAGREISRTVQAHGGYINAYTTFDRTVYYIDLPSAHIPVAVDLLADAVLHSTFPEDEFAKERNVILREIDMGRDDPDHRLSETLFSAAYRRHPHRYPVIGYKDVFSALTRADLWAYYRARYVPNNLVVVIAGDVRPAQALAWVEASFGGEPRQRLAPVLIEEEPPQLSGRQQHRPDDVDLCRAGLAWPLPGIGHPDAPVLDLLATLLGGGDSSRLWQAVREKARLVHSIDAHCWTPASAGLFYLSFTCEADRHAKASLAIRRELDRAAQKGFTASEIAKAQAQMIVGEINGRKTVSGQASRLGVAEMVVGDLGYTRGYFQALKATTSADLKRVLRTYLVPERLTSVALLPKSSALVPPSPPARASSGLEFERLDLPNGARLLFQENHKIPNVHLRVAMLGGVYAEPIGQRGASALLATLLTKDTKHRSSEEVAQAIEAVGGSLYPFSGNNSLGLAAEVLPADMELALELLRDGLLEPAFAKASLEAEKEAQIAEIRQDLDDVVAFARRSLRVRFFGDHPLAEDAAGKADDVAKLDAKALRALHQRLVVAGNVVLVVTGAFDRKAWLPRLKRWLGALPKGHLQLPHRALRASSAPGDFIENLMREQAVVTSAYPGPSLSHPDHYTGEVLDELFSGMSSQLFERVREEKGLAYFVRSTRIVGLDTSVFGFVAGTHPSHDREVEAEVRAEIERVARGGVGPEELARCQTRLKAGRIMAQQTNAARAMNAALNTLYGYPVNDWCRYDERIDAVTGADLARFAQTYLRPELGTRLIVRPE